MPQDSESRSLDKVIVRLPDGMRDLLKDEAAKNGRSMNAEIVARLTRSITLDLPEKLLARLDHEAARVNQSLSDEIQWRLEASLVEKSVLSGGSSNPKEYIDHMQEKIDELSGVLWGLQRIIAGLENTAQNLNDDSET